MSATKEREPKMLETTSLLNAEQLMEQEQQRQASDAAMVHYRAATKRLHAACGAPKRRPTEADAAA